MSATAPLVQRTVSLVQSHSASHSTELHSTSRVLRKVFTRNDEAALSASIKAKFGWEPRPFQLAGIRAQLEGCDAVIQAATGSGKTAIVAGPYVLEENRNKCTLMIVPLLALQHEMVMTFGVEFGLKAVAINSAHNLYTPGLLSDIIALRYQVILLSPEMLLSPVFIERVLRRAWFSRHIISVLIDEAHCIAHWGTDFRKKFDSLGIVRSFLTRGTPVIAVTATLTRRVRNVIRTRLDFLPIPGHVYVNAGNDRPNVSIVVRAIEHSQQSYADLAFVIPQATQTKEDIPKTYIYADSIRVGGEIIDYLALLLATRNSTLAASGVYVRPFNALLSDKYKSEAMLAFRRGDIRILVCTDAAGMGCNVSDVDRVIQWKLPKSLSQFVQRAGRAARQRDHVGLAILLVEPSAYSIVIQELSTEQAVSTADAKKGKGKMSLKKAEIKATKASGYAREHGLYRGGTTRDDTLHTQQSEPPLDMDADDEGLLTFVQTTLCRRKVWMKVFENPVENTARLNIPCCDLCDPTLLDLCRPGPKPSEEKSTKVFRGVPDMAAWLKLDSWREDKFEMNHQGTQLDSEGLLSDELITDIVSLKPEFLNTDQFRAMIKGCWVFWDRYGEELVTLVQTLDIRYIPKKRKPRAASSKAKATDSPTDTSRKRGPELSESNVPLHAKRSRTAANPAASSSSQEVAVHHTNHHGAAGLSTPPREIHLGRGSFTVPMAPHTPARSGATYTAGHLGLYGSPPVTPYNYFTQTHSPIVHGDQSYAPSPLEPYHRPSSTESPLLYHHSSPTNVFPSSAPPTGWASQFSSSLPPTTGYPPYYRQFYPAWGLPPPSEAPDQPPPASG